MQSFGCFYSWRIEMHVFQKMKIILLQTCNKAEKLTFKLSAIHIPQCGEKF